MEEKPKILARIIIEILGKPKDYVEKTLKVVVDKIKETKGIKLENYEFEKPKKVEGDVFSSFVELELWVNDISVLLGLCFDYMPSSIEILEPQEIRLKANNLSDFLNDLLANLHTLDMRLKTYVQENKVLNQNAIALIHNFVLRLLKEGNKTIQELSSVVGIKEKPLKEIIKLLEEKGLIKQEGKKYKINKIK